MARLPRLYAPRVPQLVQAQFAYPLARPDAPVPGPALDRIHAWLGEETRGLADGRTESARPDGDPNPSGDKPATAIHAWAILPDGITLLATPGDAQSLPYLMQGLGRRMGSGLMRTRVYTSRYHNALLEPGRWVLPAMVWVESLAVMAGYVTSATQWPWSSAAEHAGLAAISRPPSGDRNADATMPLTDHPDYWREGDTPFSRQAAWRKRLADGLAEPQRRQIEAALHGQWALGEKIFLTHLGRLASRRVSPAPRGRPRKPV
ncbi:hypothetical protein [Castellaniella sp. MT123]|uniref:hypothetical protein n=1 Tax=Castellaniella sp. MT123 TaxID=3140381 RepID=UPI0031F414AD